MIANLSAPALSIHTTVCAIKVAVIGDMCGDCGLTNADRLVRLAPAVVVTDRGFALPGLLVSAPPASGLRRTPLLATSFATLGGYTNETEPYHPGENTQDATPRGAAGQRPH